MKKLEFTFRGVPFVLDLATGELHGDDGDARKEIELATAIGRQGGGWYDSAGVFIPVRITDPMRDAKQFSACIFSIAPHKVSIRAPAWGATKNDIDWCASIRVSIRAPAWGATLAALAKLPPSQRFNSRSRVGSDHERDVVGVLLAVSIRAPAWGATQLPAT